MIRKYALIGFSICAAVILTYGIFHENHQDTVDEPVAYGIAFQQTEANGRAIICTYNVWTFEEKLDSMFYQIGNFRPFFIKNLDTYNRPYPAVVDWRGKQAPTKEQLLERIEPYQRGATILEITRVERDRCRIRNLDQVEGNEAVSDPPVKG